jgi:transcriptional regulator with GAF, ATPase, and Fis domain
MMVTIAMAPNARLVALSGPAQGSEFELREPEFSIGRDDLNSLCLADLLVSRRHCVIQRDGAEFRLRDLQSANQTTVNGQPTEESRLAHGDQIVVGSSYFVFLLEQGGPLLPAEQIFSATSTAVLRRDQALYLRPDQMVDAAVRSGQAAQHLKSMLRAAAAIASARDLEELEQELMESLAQAIPAERGAIVLHDEVSGGLSAGTFAAAYHWSRKGAPDPSFRVPASVAGRVWEDGVAEGVAVCLNDVLTSPGADVAASVALSRINSLMAAPVASGDERLAMIYLDTRDPKVRFDEDHLQLLTGIAGVAAAPLDKALRLKRLEMENQRLEAELRGEGGMVGSSGRIREVYQFIRKAAPSLSTVLIHGESGTGKELVARAIHHGSPRAAKPFVAINCAAITETLLESEFFGHEKGAFTGAVGQKKGKLEEANGGTVFLDEIGELALTLQAKLLRVLQEREFERVGSTRTIKVDIRVLAATNRDLTEMVRKGTFRQDLYYRLNVVSLTLPALRERRDDILPLADYFLQKHRSGASRMVQGVSAEARTCLMNYDWPGNVRELENAIEHAIVLGSAENILADDLPDSIVESGDDRMASDSPGPGGKFHETIREMKRQLVLKALEQAQQSYTEAAKLLGLHPNNLHRLMKNLNLKTSK